MQDDTKKDPASEEPRADSTRLVPPPAEHDHGVDSGVTPPPAPGDDPDQTSAMQTRRKTVLGGFPVEEKIGEGGMGIVYRAFDPDLHRRVAIKKIHPRLAGDAEYSERFIDEARAVAAVTHTHIAQIFSIHAADPDAPAFFVMEYVDGPSVQELVTRDGPLPLTRALEITLQAARGLRAAHLRGLVHRDIKPSNILTTLRGEVKIVDFGLARWEQEIDRHRTQPGVVFGSPHYASPEQARGWAVDHRSDIYSLGCTLYYMLAGEEPFAGKNAVDVVMAHTSTPPPRLTRRRPEATPPMEALVQRMLAKKPEERPQTYDELIGELVQLLDQRAPAARHWRPGLLQLTGILLVAITGAALIAVVVERTRPRPVPDPATYFGRYYVQSDNRQGEGLHFYPFDMPTESLRKYVHWADKRDPENRDERAPYTHGNRLTWANYNREIVLPRFEDIDTVELDFLRFSGPTDFELVLGRDADHPGNWLRIYFGVGDRNDSILQCCHYGEPAEIEGHDAFGPRLDFTIIPGAEYKLLLVREDPDTPPDTKQDRTRYHLTITQRLEDGGEQNWVNLHFFLPAHVRLSGSVRLRAEGLRMWSVSLQSLLVRGTLDRRWIEEQVRGYVE